MNVFGLSFILFYLYLKAGLQFSIHNNKWQCNSFFCTKKETFWDFEMQKKFFCVRTQPWTLAAAPHPPDPPCTQLYAFGLIPPLLLCEYVLCGWPPNKPTDGGGGGGLIIFQGFKVRRLLESSTEKKDALISESEELFTVTFKT